MDRSRLRALGGGAVLVVLVALASQGATAGSRPAHNASPAGAGPSGFAVTADRTSGPAGTTVQLAGVQCVPGLGSFVAVKLAPAGPLPVFDNTDPTLEVYEVSGPDASFAGGFGIPAGTAPGAYQLVAWCLGEGGQVLLGTTAQVLPFEVTAGAFAATLDRSSGPPGDDIELTAVDCPGDFGAAAFLPVGAPPASPSDVPEDVLQQYDILDGQFGGVVPVPAGTAPGTYQVVVWCMAGEEVLESVVLGYTVTAGAAVPVPADPDFTG